MQLTIASLRPERDLFKLPTYLIKKAGAELAKPSGDTRDIFALAC